MSTNPNVVVYDQGTPENGGDRWARCLACDWTAVHPLVDVADHPTFIPSAIINHHKAKHWPSPIRMTGVDVDMTGYAPPSTTDSDQAPPEEGSASVVELAKEAVSIIQRLTVALHVPESMHDHNIEIYRQVFGDVSLAEGCLMDALATIVSSGRTFE